MSIRLAKWIATTSSLSRRQAEEAIAQRRITVNGHIVDTPVFWVSEGHEVCLDGRPLSCPSQVVVWKAYKPRGCLVTRSDPQGRATLWDKLRFSLTEGRAVTVGRLDYESEGLILMTNAPRLAHVLEHPETGWTRVYHVGVAGAVPAAVLAPLEKGFTVEGIHYRPCQVKILSTSPQQTWLRMALWEGKNREIRRLLAAVSVRVERLIRISFGPFALGGLRPGEVKKIPPTALRASLKADWLQIG